jgi:hypothetical protein
VEDSVKIERGKVNIREVNTLLEQIPVKANKAQIYGKKQ